MEKRGERGLERDIPLSQDGGGGRYGESKKLLL
jgi:hypothetical protein